MRIRWMQRKRKITVEMVKEYSRKHTISMNQAKQELEKDNTGKWFQKLFYICFGDHTVYFIVLLNSVSTR